MKDSKNTNQAVTTGEHRIFKKVHGNSGRRLKYGEPTIKIHPFWCPVSKKADLDERIKGILAEYEQEYKERIQEAEERMMQVLKDID